MLIKITYVAELQVQGELIDFFLPGSLAPWEKESALSQVVQVNNMTFIIYLIVLHMNIIMSPEGGTYSFCLC